MKQQESSLVNQERPIIVSGLPRSGTTWMQHFLSLHPDVQIHGQPPKDFPWSVAYEWFQTLAEKGEWAEQANARLVYEAPHYAGASPERCAEVFRCFYRDFMTGFGPQKPLWGLKYIGLCCLPDAVEQFESLWPETRWVIGIRNPFRSLNSIRNTFSPDYGCVEWFSEWLDSCRFVDEHDPRRVCEFDIDQLATLDTDDRITVLQKIVACVGIEFTEPMLEYINDWPKIHEVKSISKREIKVDQSEIELAFLELPELRNCLTSRGYSEEFVVENS